MKSVEEENYSFIKDLVIKNRTYRRFYQDCEISTNDLEKLIELARLSGFGGNRQSFKFWAVKDENLKKEIFKDLKWANYYKDWDGPAEGERPSAYIIIFHDKNISSSYFWDHGIAAQSILLGAAAIGLGGCMFASFSRQGIKDALGASENLTPLIVIALGKPREEVIIDCLEKDGSIEYWRDKQDRHHVPKRALKDIMKIF